MWKYFFLGLLVGWLLEWIIDWFYWRSGADGDPFTPAVRADLSEGHGHRSGVAAEGAARSAAAAVQSGTGVPLAPVTAVETGAVRASGASNAAAGDNAVGGDAVGGVAAGAAPEPNEGDSTGAGTAAGRVAADVAKGAPGAVSTSSATLTSRAPVYRQEDLEAVVGIGPKIGAMLRNNGITTFAQLAVTPIPELERIVESTGEEPVEAGVHTWAAQASLAAAQDWEGFARLQDELQSSGAAARREA